eukprot:TRINITY_DN23919_c0_g1_i1.p1 TRINITY_DN23919_c0_g1~~TRINITY_DN23919_c0_g1_i1.p1  ORF type:complete len:925 (+),score=156.48 TRINITY_DN23919_c0_g1_i1:204-2978(+)
MAELQDGDEQMRVLEEAFGFVAEQRFYFRKAVQKNDLEMALRYSFCLANELRATRLLPVHYYKLYALVFWELQHLAAFVACTDRHGLSIADIYELVQLEGNILPRLYVLVTVGAVYIQSARDELGQEILDDVCNMLSAVQHPVRGLFLRYFMLQMVKDKLVHVGGARRALRFLLANLRESVSLWARLRLEDGGSAAVGVIPGRHDSDALGVIAAAVPTIASDVLSTSQAEGQSALIATGHDGIPAEGLLAQVWSLSRNQQTLQMLIGAHLMHMSQLEMLSEDLHAEVVLPEVLRLSNGEDPAGQAYLLECFVELFPDSYHLHSLDQLLAACAQLQWVVDLKYLLKGLMQRLTGYLRRVVHVAAPSAQSPSPPRPEGSLNAIGGGGASCCGDTGGSDTVEFANALSTAGCRVDSFAAFEQYLQQLRARPRTAGTPLASLLELQVELMTVAILLHPTDSRRMELVLGGTVELIVQRPQEEPLDTGSVSSIISVLAAPLTSATVVPTVLTMPHHLTLVEALGGRAVWRCASVEMVKALLEGDVPISDCASLRRLLELLDPLIHDDAWHHDKESAQHQEVYEHDPVAFAAEQQKVAQLVHQIRHPSPSVSFEMLKVIRGYLDESGPHRVVYTLPACLVATIRLAKPLVLERHRRVSTSGVPEDEGRERSSSMQTEVPEAEELFRFAWSLLEDGLPPGVLSAEERLRLWLLVAASTERADRALGEARGALSAACLHAVHGAMSCLEADVGSGSRSQLPGLQLFVGTLQQITCLSEESYQSVAARVMKFSERLPTRRMQSRALSICVHLYWGLSQRDPPRALGCLQAALRFGDGALHVDPTDVDLFIEILDQAVYLFGQGNSEITASLLSGFIALCVQHLRYIEGRVPAEAQRSLAATLHQLETRAVDTRDDRYAKIKLVKLEARHLVES